MAQPKSSKSSSSKSKSSKKVAAPATGKKVSRVVAAKSAKTVELEPVKTVAAVVAPEVVVLPEVVVAEVVEVPVRHVSRAEFMELVRKEAYRRAHSRHFRNGSPFQDWVNAEAAVSGKLAAEGARLS